MKPIAFIGDPSRGKDIIHLLEQLGGKNTRFSSGTVERCIYSINKDNIICTELLTIRSKDRYNLYTIEEFEKEFPFKIGDKVVWDKDNYTAVRTVLRIDYSDLAGIKYAITAFGAANCFWEVDVNELKSYKEMKEERNITLTLDKAKEWYKKGGELKEVALQAYSEKELNPLPRSWEEYCRIHGCVCLSARYTNISTKYDALIKLEQLKDCWKQGWVQTPTDTGYRISKTFTGDYTVLSVGTLKYFLSFPTREMAREFLECFKDLIEKAGDLI